MLLLRYVKFLIVGLVLFLGVSLFNSTFSSSGLLKEKDSKAYAHYMMGIFYERQGKFDEAIVEYKDALKLDKDITAIYMRLAISHVRKGELDKAIEELEEIKKLDPDDLDAGFMRALLYSLQNSSDKAIKEYEEVLKKAVNNEPKNIYILKGLAAVYYQQKEFEKAIQTYKLILEIDKNDYEALFLMGSILEDSGRRHEAIEKFKQTLLIKPDYADALNSLGYVYAEEGKNLERAKELIEKALSVDPDNGAYIDSLGWVYFKMNLIDKAIEELEKAASLLSDPVIYDHLGDSYFKKGLLDKASSVWNKSLELDPSKENVIRKKLNRTYPTINR